MKHGDKKTKNSTKIEKCSWYIALSVLIRLASAMCLGNIILQLCWSGEQSLCLVPTRVLMEELPFRSLRDPECSAIKATKSLGKDEGLVGGKGSNENRNHVYTGVLPVSPHNPSERGHRGKRK